MCILISARIDLKQNLGWNRIKFPSRWPSGSKGARACPEYREGFFQTKSAINLATCSIADTHKLKPFFSRLALLKPVEVEHLLMGLKWGSDQ